MHALANNVLGQLKYDILAGAVSLVVKPLAGAPPFVLPPAPTDAGAGAPTYGQPFGIVTLIDRLDASAAKIEHILYTGKAAEAGGAFTYSGLLRGQEGTAGQAWVTDAYVIQQATTGVLDLGTRIAALRAQSLLLHRRDSLLTWDGASFGFLAFEVQGAGRGRHWSTDGRYTIAIPANGTLVKGYAGAADQNVAAGAIPIAALTALYYEPYIAGPLGSIAGNFKLVSYAVDFLVPPHWILLAVHGDSAGGDKTLRLASGATLYPWRAIGAGGEPAFANGWVNFGAPYQDAAFRKDDAGLVYLRGAIKTGTVNLTMFTLPAGYRPSAEIRRAISSNAAFAELAIDAAGVVKMPAGGSNVVAHLNVPPFQAAN